MRRTPHPFAVEVRRHRGKSAIIEAKPFTRDAFFAAALLSLSAEEAKISSDSDRAEDPNPKLVSPQPSGRILPSLVEVSPWPEASVKAETPRKPAREPGARRKTAKRAKAATAEVLEASRLGLSDSADLTIDLTVAATGVAAPERKSSAKTRRGDAAANKKPQRRAHAAKTPKIPPIAAAPVAANPPAPAVERQANPATRGDGPRQERRRSIMARYVFGTELRPGERWKKRLRKPR